MRHIQEKYAHRHVSRLKRKGEDGAAPGGTASTL